MLRLLASSPLQHQARTPANGRDGGEGSLAAKRPFPLRFSLELLPSLVFARPTRTNESFGRVLYVLCFSNNTTSSV